MNISKKDIIIGNFLGGLSWGVGSVVGIALVTAAIGFALSALGVFATIGGFFSGLANTGSQLQNFQNLPQVPNIYK